MSDEFMKLINGKRFNGRTKHKYKCLEGYHEMEYKCYYQLSKEVVPKKIYCEFTTYFPIFGYEKIYGSGGLEKTKKLELSHLDLNVFSEFPTPVHDRLEFISEHFPSSEDEKDLQVFHEKVHMEIEELIPSIIGDGFCISHEKVLKLDAKDRKYMD